MSELVNSIRKRLLMPSQLLVNIHHAQLLSSLSDALLWMKGERKSHLFPPSVTTRDFRALFKLPSASWHLTGSEKRGLVKEERHRASCTATLGQSAGQHGVGRREAAGDLRRLLEEAEDQAGELTWGKLINMGIRSHHGAPLTPHKSFTCSMSWLPLQ